MICPINISDAKLQLKVFFKENQFSHYYVLVDVHTHGFCLPLFLEILSPSNLFEIIEIEAGEAHKNINACLKIWQHLSASNADRKTVLINLGGGVVCDIGGFAASVYKRGIAYINVPTTLLAMVDAAIGGKTGVDLGVYKNQIGLIAQPKAVFIIPDFLKTLPHNELVNAYAEIIKHALIKDSDLWDALQKNAFDNIDTLISKAVEIKSHIVAHDMFEHNVRKILNFGHSIGHALEMLSPEIFKKQISHGQAVAAGIICASYISCKLTGLNKNDLKSITDFVNKFFTKLPIEKEHYDKIINLMVHDKKNVGGQIGMVLLKNIGNAVYDIKVTREDISESFAYYLST